MMKQQQRHMILAMIMFFFAISISAQTEDRLSYDLYFNPAPTAAFGTSKDFSPASPQAGGLGLFGQVPVSNFTGTAEINIPLYEVKYKELSVPIGINYHAAGVKPDLLPGPVGLGWSLQAGGVITRIVKGYPDIETGKKMPGQSGTISLVEDFRGDNDWNSQAKLDRVLKGYTKLTFFQNIEPDEFCFNFNGFSGKFYLQHTDTFSIQSQQSESFKVVRGAEKGIPNFTLIDSKGIKYFFAGVEYTESGLNGTFFDDPDMDNWNSAIATSWNLTSIQSPNGYEIKFNYLSRDCFMRNRFMDISYFHGELVNKSTSMYMDNEKVNSITVFYLSEIETPVEKIKFNIERAHSQLDYPPLDVSDVSNFMFRKNGSLFEPLRPCQVTSLKVADLNDNEIKKVNFVYSYNNKERLKLMSVDMVRSQPYPATHDYIISQYRFYYNTTPLPPYLSGQTDHYGYYNGKNFFSRDIRLKVAAMKSPDDAKFQNLMQAIEQVKKPDIALVQAEILNKIEYPTGGYTTFEYEPHQYGYTKETWPFVVNKNTDGNKITGGVRIKAIRNFNHDESLLTEKKYHYTKDYITGGTESSGVLAYTPRYAEYIYDKFKISEGIVQGKFPVNFFRITSNPIYPLNPVGNHITYSEVAIEEPGNGFTVYKYQNYDNNGHNDQEPFSYALTMHLGSGVENGVVQNPVEYWKEDEGISMELERGLLLSQEVFDNNKITQKRIDFAYNDDPNRFDQQVRYFRYVPNGFSVTAYNYYRISSGVRYTYFPYLKEKITTENGIVQKEAYEYDTDYRLIKSITTSDSRNKSMMVKMIYPFELPTGIETRDVQHLDVQTNDAICSRMTDSCMFAYPVEKRNYIDQKLVIRELFQYAGQLVEEKPELTLLNKHTRIQVGKKQHAATTVFPRYDITANPVRILNQNSGEESILIWSYNGMYPIAEIKNADFDAVDYTLAVSFEESNNYILDLAQKSRPTTNDMARINNLRSVFPKAQITTYTYQPLVGVSSVTDPRGITTYYRYDILNRLAETYIIEDGVKNVIQAFDYHYRE